MTTPNYFEQVMIAKEAQRLHAEAFAKGEAPQTILGEKGGNMLMWLAAENLQGEVMS